MCQGQEFAIGEKGPHLQSHEDAVLCRGPSQRRPELRHARAVLLRGGLHADAVGRGGGQAAAPAPAPGPQRITSHRTGSHGSHNDMHDSLRGRWACTGGGGGVEASSGGGAQRAEAGRRVAAAHAGAAMGAAALLLSSLSPGLGAAARRVRRQGPPAALRQQTKGSSCCQACSGD